MKIHMQHSQELEKIILWGLIIFHYLIQFNFYHSDHFSPDVFIKLSCLSINITPNHFVFLPLIHMNKKTKLNIGMIFSNLVYQMDGAKIQGSQIA